MTFNQDNLDGEAIHYFGTSITYGQLPGLRDAYARGLKMAGVKEGDVVTMRAGAGIVADSDPKKEYQETVNNSKAVFEAVKFAEEEL